MNEALEPARRRAITWRSLGLGMGLALAIVTITPYNDYVVNNSFIVGSYFPPIVTLAMLAIVLLVNGPLHRWAPRLALSSGELAIVLAMALIACSVPSQGLLRQVLPLPVASLPMSGDSPQYRRVLKEMNLPPSLLAVDNIDDGHLQPAVTHFYNRLPEGASIPWHAWVGPVLSWGAFVGFFLLTLLSIAALVRYQWAVNERLAFPIAELQSMLIAPPAPGRALNGVFSSRGFWVALSAVVVVQSSAWLNGYFPKTVPVIPLGYNLTGMLSEAPWSYLGNWVAEQSIIFMVLGLAYFSPTRVSFSLWGGALLLTLVSWPFNVVGSSAMSGAVMRDQQLGAVFAFLAGVLWIGRHHWAVIARAMAGRPHPNDARGVFVSYRIAGFALLLGLGGMVGWLLWAGCVWWMVVLIVVMIVTAQVVTARVVAETGFPFVRVPVGMQSIVTNIPASEMTPRDGWLFGMGQYAFMRAARENAMTFALHGMQVVESAEVSPRQKRALAPVLSGTLFVALVAGVIAGLWCYYNYSVPLDPNANMTELNPFGTRMMPSQFLRDLPMQINSGSFPAKSHPSWLNMLIGVAIMATLQGLTWRFSAWPLLPVGYLMAESGYTRIAALSLFMGWLAKTLILRFGGAHMFVKLKPVFIGLIFGEALGTGVWLIITLIRAMNGSDFHIVHFLPQ